MSFFHKDLDREFQQLQHIVERSLEHWMYRRRSSFFAAGEWEPPIDIYETKEAIIILAEIAGVKREDLRLVVEGDILAITGYRENRAPANRIGCTQLEIDYGRFARTIPLSQHIDREKITVTYQDGFLEIIVPRIEQRGTRRIEIETE